MQADLTAYNAAMAPKAAAAAAAAGLLSADASLRERAERGRDVLVRVTMDESSYHPWVLAKDQAVRRLATVVAGESLQVRRVFFTGLPHEPSMAECCAELLGRTPGAVNRFGAGNWAMLMMPDDLGLDGDSEEDDN
jgi:hypothetical protein